MRILLQWSGLKQPFVYPVPPVPRTVVLQPWFRPAGPVRVFRPGVFMDGWSGAAAAYSPLAIAGTWPQVEALIPEKIPSLSHALIVLASPGDALLTGSQRDKLWRAFRVPVFQQITSRSGLLLAAECEAHDGLHIESPQFVVVGPIDKSPCGCGRTTPRLKLKDRPAPLRVAPLRAAAAAG